MYQIFQYICNVMKMNKYLFLDCDGVVNHEEWYERYWNEELQYTNCDYDIDPLVIKRLNKLVEETGCEIVMSSSWRFDFEISVNRLKLSGLKYDINERIDGCEFGGNVKRGELIRKFIMDNPCDNYLILDDDDDMLEEQSDHFIKVDRMVGFTDENLYNAVDILNG